MAAALYIFFCYFDFDIVSEANRAQYHAEVEAGYGKTVKTDIYDDNKVSKNVGSSTGNQVGPTTGGEVYRRA